MRVNTMHEGAMGMGILIVLAAVAAVVCHRVIHNLLAAAAAAGIATLTFQLIVRLQLGYLDAFFPIALVVGGALAFLIALLVGVLPAVRPRTK
jgi:hypothetical protein